MKTFYAILTVIGFVAADVVIYLFIRQYGFDVIEMLRQGFASPGAALAWVDILISSFVFWGFMVREARKHQISNLWVYVILNLFVGLCAALPAFLYVRQGKIEQNAVVSLAHP